MTPKACEEYAAMLKRETVEAKLAKVRAEQSLAKAQEVLREIADLVSKESVRKHTLNGIIASIRAALTKETPNG